MRIHAAGAARAMNKAVKVNHDTAFSGYLPQIRFERAETIGSGAKGSLLDKEKAFEGEIEVF